MLLFTNGETIRYIKRILLLPKITLLEKNVLIIEDNKLSMENRYTHQNATNIKYKKWNLSFKMKDDK
jgi:hypothetical protein